jgi:hypothetical protein
MYELTFCDTRSGDRLQNISFDSLSSPWQRMLGVASGRQQTALPLHAVEFSRSDIRGLTVPWDRTLVLSWNGTPRYAGLITGRPYSASSNVVTLRHDDLRQLWLARYPFGEDSYWADDAETIPGKLELSMLSWQAIAARVVYESITGPRDNYGLPIVLPSMTEAGTAGFFLDNYTFTNTADALDNIQAQDGAPEIDFLPRWSPTTGRLEWVLDMGTWSEPLIRKNTIEVNYAAPNPGLVELDTEEDALKQATGLFVTGEGSGQTLVVGADPDAPHEDIPALDRVVRRGTTRNAGEARLYAIDAFRLHKSPTVEWNGTIRVNGDIALDDMTTGTILRVNIPETHPWHEPGWRDLRVVEMTGDYASEDVSFSAREV